MDTPGIVSESETSATRSTFEQIDEADRVMLVARADRAAEELPLLLPSVAGKTGFIILTFKDQLPPKTQLSTKKLAASLGVPIFLLNARNLQEREAYAIRTTASTPVEKLNSFPLSLPSNIPWPTIEPVVRKNYLEKISSHPLAALFLLFLPASFAICLLYTSPSPRDQRGSRMPSSA